MTDTFTCGDCKRATHIDLLDAVLLDEDGREASDELYCQICWPRHRVVPWDQWRPSREDQPHV